MPEVNLELLVGRKVRTRSGENAGRIQEVVAEHQGDEWVITEYQLGPVVLLSRLSAFHLAAPLFHLLGADKDLGYKVQWDKLDLSDPDRPILTCETADLERLTPEGS